MKPTSRWRAARQLCKPLGVRGAQGLPPESEDGRRVAPEQHEDEGIAVLGQSRVGCTYFIERLNQAAYELVEVCLPCSPHHLMACPRAAPGVLGSAVARGTLAAMACR